MMTQQVAHTAKVCTKVNHDFLKHGGMNFCPDCGANVRDEANSLVRAAAPELLSEARINLGVLKEVHAYLRNRTGNLEVQLCEMVGESISHSEAAISKAETGQ